MARELAEHQCMRAYAGEMRSTHTRKPRNSKLELELCPKQA
jgi:hypothetical protein